MNCFAFVVVRCKQYAAVMPPADKLCLVCMYAVGVIDQQHNV